MQTQQQATVGHLLKQMRADRRISQLDLALEAGISSRHLSFVETGRSKPSADMIQRLASSLSSTLRETNALYWAAGFVPPYSHSAPDEPAFARVHDLLKRFLDQQEPNPAVVVDCRWNLLLANAGAARIFDGLLGRSLQGAGDAEGPNLLQLFFEPGGLRQHVANWEAVAAYLLARIRHEPLIPTQERQDLATKMEQLADFFPPDHGSTDLSNLPGLPVALKTPAGPANFMSMLTTFSAPLDVTLQEIRIETFFPENDTALALVHQHSEAHDP